MTSPLLGCSMKAREDSGHACKSDMSLVGNPTPYTESLHGGLVSWPPQGSAAWEESMLTHGQCRLGRCHSSICDCLTGGDWPFLLCHQMVLKFSDFGSTSKRTFEWREIDWVTKKSQFTLAGQRMQNMELGRQSHWIWGEVLKEMKTSLYHKCLSRGIFPRAIISGLSLV